MKYLLALFFCCIGALQLLAQTAPADTTFTTDFSFAGKTGDPNGLFRYKGPGENPLCVFEYSDGRKYFGDHYARSTSPFSGFNGTVYYPDGTIYLTNLEVSVVRYPDGTVFFGKDEHYKQRYGFQFAPDGSYMVGSFWYKTPWAALMYATLHYSADHKRVSEGYHLKYRDQEMDLPTFLEAYKKLDQKVISPYQKITWKHRHQKNTKYEADFEDVGYRGNKDDHAVGFYRAATLSHNGKNYVYQGTIFDTKYSMVSFREPGDTVSITTPDISYPVNMTGAERSKIPGAMQFISTMAKYARKGDPDITAYAFDNGDFYAGWTKSGRFDDYGIYKYKDGTTYFGNWATGRRDGWGTVRFTDGSYFKGAWKNDMRNGPGRMFNADGSLLQQGIFTADKLTTRQTVSLDYYELIDEFPPASKNTIASILVTDKKLPGATYTGSMAGDKPDGQGTLIIDDTGDKYAGKWHNGLPDGVFEVTYAPAKIDGKIISSTYKGGLKDFRREGEGRLITTNGEMSGTFHEGKLNGQGTLRNAEGDGESGMFINNVKEGRFEITNKNNYNLGHYTYVHGVRHGDAYLMSPELNKDASGEYVNGKEDGQWTVYARNMHYESGQLVSAPTRLGYVTYKNGVVTGSEAIKVAPTDFNRNNGNEQPACTYCSGTGSIGSGKFFMGKEYPIRCPRCGGTGHTWLNPKN